MLLAKNVFNPLSALLRYTKFTKKYEMQDNEQIVIALALAMNEYKHDNDQMTKDINFYGKRYVLDEFKTKKITYNSFNKLLFKSFVKQSENCETINTIHQKKINNDKLLKNLTDYF